MKKRILILTATVATAVASMVASSACLLFFYQPQEPKCLREE